MDRSAELATAHGDREWLVPMAVVTALQFGLWCAMWLAGMAARPLVGLYDLVAIIGLGIALVPFVLWYLLDIHKQGETQPLKRIAADIQMNRVLAVLVALLLAPVTASAFSALKSALPLAVPFYLDHGIAGIERGLFGTDPWRISHQLFGWATPLIDRFYLSWLPVMLVAFNLVVLSRPSRAKTQSLIAYLLIWPVVGTAGSYLLSSAGPIFQDALFGGHSGLLDALQREGASGTLHAYHYLLNAYSSRFETLGGGISAMPSVHVAMACWLALTVRKAFPRVQWIGWTYLALIWLGSVHLGWHFVSDGLVGALGALLMWKAAASIGSADFAKGKARGADLPAARLGIRGHS